MNRFERRLQESLGTLGSEVDAKSFLRFAGAIATSTALEKIPMALERAAAMPPDQLAQIIGQVQYTGDVAGLKNAVASKPEYAVMLSKLARQVMPEDQVQAVVEVLTPKADGEPAEATPKLGGDDSQYQEGKICPRCGNGILESNDYEAITCTNCGSEVSNCNWCGDSAMSEDLDENGSCPDCRKASTPEEMYNTEADYYTQGEDPNGH